jgi:hypothetical protein
MGGSSDWRQGTQLSAVSPQLGLWVRSFEPVSGIAAELRRSRTARTGGAMQNFRSELHTRLGNDLSEVRKMLIGLIQSLKGS